MFEGIKISYLMNHVGHFLSSSLLWYDDRIKVLTLACCSAVKGLRAWAASTFFFSANLADSKRLDVSSFAFCFCSSTAFLEASAAWAALAASIF